jgi:hypothetical protein
MRTTVSLPDHLYVDARRLAAERKTSLTALLEEGLRMLLGEARKQQPPTQDDDLPLIRGPKLRRGIDLTDTSELLEIE